MDRPTPRQLSDTRALAREAIRLRDDPALLARARAAPLEYAASVKATPAVRRGLVVLLTLSDADLAAARPERRPGAGTQHHTGPLPTFWVGLL